MSAPAPQATAIELWNRIVRLRDEDGAELDRINWTLRGLALRHPGDFDVRLAAGLGLLRRGLRRDALPHVDTAWGLRLGRDYTDLINLTGVLGDCGRIAEARSVGDGLLRSPEAVDDVSLHSSMVDLAFRSGDLDLIEPTEMATGRRDEKVADFVDGLRQEDLDGAFLRHQRIVEEVLGPHTCGFTSRIVIDDEGEASLALTYFTELGGRERLRLYRLIAERKTDPDVLRVSPRIGIGVSGPAVRLADDAA